MPRTKVVSKQAVVSPLLARVGEKAKTRFVTQAMDNMYGDLEKVDPKILREKKVTMKTAFDKIAFNVELILNMVEDESTRLKSLDPTFPSMDTATTRAYFAPLIEGKDAYIESHPHAWVRSPLLAILYGLRTHANKMDEFSNGAFEQKEYGRFVRWQSDTKELLPGKINFSLLPDILIKVFIPVCEIFDNVLDIIKLVIQPSYDWQGKLRRSIELYGRDKPIGVRKTLEAQEPSLHRQVTAAYFRALKVDDSSIDISDLLSTFAERISSKDHPEIKEELIESLAALTDRSKKSMRPYAAAGDKVFGKDLMQSLVRSAKSGSMEDGSMENGSMEEAGSAGAAAASPPAGAEIGPVAEASTPAAAPDVDSADEGPVGDTIVIAPASTVSPAKREKKKRYRERKKLRDQMKESETSGVTKTTEEAGGATKITDDVATKTVDVATKTVDVATKTVDVATKTVDVATTKDLSPVTPPSKDSQ
jgi:hypothetical protein